MRLLQLSVSVCFASAFADLSQAEAGGKALDADDECESGTCALQALQMSTRKLLEAEIPSLCSSYQQIDDCNAEPLCKWCLDASFEGTCQSDAYEATDKEECGIVEKSCKSFGPGGACSANVACKNCRTYDQNYSYCIERDSNEAAYSNCDGDDTVTVQNEIIIPNSTSKGESSSPKLQSSGASVIVYHQTSLGAAASIRRSGFRPGTGGWCGGAIYFATSPRATETKAISPTSQLGYMISARLNIGRAIRLNNRCQGVEEARRMGYNTVIFNPGDGDEYVTWDSSRISVIGASAYQNSRNVPRWHRR